MIANLVYIGADSIFGLTFVGFIAGHISCFLILQCFNLIPPPEGNDKEDDNNNSTEP